MFFDLKKKEKRVANLATLFLCKGGAEFGGDTAQLRKAVNVWALK